MRSVLITGGAGFIGANFAHHLLATRPGVSIVTLDALTYAGSTASLPRSPHHRFVHGNICDRPLVTRLLQEHRIDTIVHFAAETHVDRSLVAPEAFLQTNILGTAALLECARHVWIEQALPLDAPSRFHQVGTDEVYGDRPSGLPPSVEEDAYRPSSPYAASKAGADHLAWAWRRSHGLPVTGHLAANTYGPRQFPEKLLPLFILRALRGEPLPVYGDGHQLRDWLHVNDHCAAIVAILEGPEGRRWNVSAGVEVSNLDFIRHICATLDTLHPTGSPHSDLITHVPDRPGHDRRYAVDAGALRAELGWRPTIPWRAGVAETVRWYLDNPDWLSAIQSSPAYQEWIEQRYGR
ncbi:MAG: dTDP-glucose 4,6-dehydratase [Myxococcota bacterium]|jgi:dTDP-glucose 4,6-dehydratase